MSKYLKLILVTAAAFLAMQTSYSRSDSVGASFSYTGLSVAYGQYMPEKNSFMELYLTAEMSEVIADRASHPGVSASMTWNIILKEWISSEGNTLRFYAGPGAYVGYTRDHKTKTGFAFGLKGRLGVECNYTRNVTLSLSVSPIIGSHITGEFDRLSMKYYRNGLMYSLVPEIGIKYRF